MRRPLLMALACLLAAGCGASAGGRGGREAEARYAANGVFTIAARAEVGSFDPYHSPGMLGYDDLLYDSLVNPRPDGTFVSGLAGKWTADARSATFTLRRDVTCSDGTPLTASQVAAAISYVGDPANQSPLYGLHTPTVPLTAKGDDTGGTVTVTVAKPFGFLLETVGVLPIVCAKGMRDRAVLKEESNGTGPYVLADVVQGQSYTFTVRKDYRWGPGGAGTGAPGTPAKVVIRVISNETTAANLMLQGEVNFAAVTGEDHRRLDSRKLEKAETHDGVALWFNQVDGRLTEDRRLRRALVQALRIDDLIRVSTGGTGTAATGLVALDPKVCDGEPLAGRLPEYDVAAAGALLDEAGWVKGADGVRRKDGKPLTLDLHYIPTNNRFDRPTAELAAQQWKSLGVDVKLTADGPSGYTEVVLGTGDWDVFVLGYGFYLPSQWIPYASGPVPPKGVNVAGIDNADYGDLVAKAQTMTAPEACAYWNQAEQALFRDVNVAPIAFRTTFYYLRGARADVSGFSFPVPTSIRVLE